MILAGVIMYQESLQIPTEGRGIWDISVHVNAVIRRAEIKQGMCNIFIHHTSASLFINENADPNVKGDLERFFARLVPDGDSIFLHTEEGTDDMSAHVRSVLTATSLNVPVKEGRCDLGRWQGLFLWEHRKDRQTRKVTVSVWD